jgi:hypothetical protein
LNPHHRHSLLVAALLPHLSDLGNSPLTNNICGLTHSRGRV